MPLSQPLPPPWLPLHDCRLPTTTTPLQQPPPLLLAKPTTSTAIINHYYHHHRHAPTPLPSPTQPPHHAIVTLAAIIITIRQKGPRGVCFMVLSTKGAFGITTTIRPYGLFGLTDYTQGSVWSCRKVIRECLDSSFALRVRLVVQKYNRAHLGLIWIK
nr:hypothetical protein [Tanacetum cinerariifolium]